MKKKKKNKGFSLVELFIATAIMLLAASAVYSAFSNGVNVWRRCNINREVERDIAINLTKMARAIKNTFEFSTIPFEGTDEAISFAAIINEDEVGKVSYFFDGDKNELYKNESTYIQLYGIDPEAEIESFGGTVFISDVSDWKFSYCYLDNATGKYEWKDSWKKEEQDSIPQAVKIDFSLKKYENEVSNFTKTVFIPTGTGEQKLDLDTLLEGIADES